MNLLPSNSGEELIVDNLEKENPGPLKMEFHSFHATTIEQY
jgi:hypothetical protein